MPPLLRTGLPRIITYYQTHHDAAGNHISLLPLLTQPGIGLTHVVLAAFHLNEDPSHITLNDHVPSHPRFQTLWAEARVLQASGVTILGMLGGAAKGTYRRLDLDDATFERYYVPLREMVKERSLNGLDLDVEEEMSLGSIVRLIDRIRADFGPSFIITLAPVAAALLNATHNLSGFDYEALEVLRGKEIAWYNAQFYCGWGDCSSPLMYEMILTRGWPIDKIVVGLVTNPENGSGFVPWEMLGSVLLVLRGRYARFAGVMGWEYFNSLPAGKERPWEWARWMTTMLKGLSDGHHGVVAGASVGVPAPATPGTVGVLAEKVQKELVEEADPDGPNSKDAPLPLPFEYYSDGLDED